MRRGFTVWAAAVAALAFSAPIARGLPASGPRETVDVATSTPHPNASAGLTYAATYHAAGDPNGDPPALRHLLIQLPPGTRIDSSVPARCTASDAEIMLVGDAACPGAARVGRGQATVQQIATGMVSTFPTVLYNADHDLLELVEAAGGRVLGIAHTYQHGTTLDGPVPTCMTGGDPPDGCPFDEMRLLANHLTVDPVTIDGRNYGTTPRTCPPAGYWTTRVTLSYADGSVDAVAPRTPCTRR
jgi:hypothetical protein